MTNNDFRIEDVPALQIVEQTGTPVYVYSQSAIERNWAAFCGAVAVFPKRTVCFAVKSNANIAVLRLLASSGAGADIVSGAELELALRAGIPADKIVFSGVGKTEEEIAAAVAAGIKQINAESAEELETIAAVARTTGKKPAVGIRVNPDVDAHTHAKITTGTKGAKFGIDWTDARPLYGRYKDSADVRLTGIEIHVGSQLLSPGPFRETFKKTAGMLRDLAADGVRIETVDVGGGLGVPYRGEDEALAPAAYAALLKEELGAFDGEFVFEPGRYIVGDAGWLLARVVRTKTTGGRNFAVLDAGMNDLIRPALYDAYHEVAAFNGKPADTLYDVVGPVCESSDVFGRDRLLPKLEAGDCVALCTAGAYGATMSSTYNCRPLAPEVLVKGGRFAVVRRRQTIGDMIGFQQLPDWISG